MTGRSSLLGALSQMSCCPKGDWSPRNGSLACSSSLSYTHTHIVSHFLCFPLRIVLMDDAMDCLMSFSDFLFAFQIQFYYSGKTLPGPLVAPVGTTSPSPALLPFPSVCLAHTFLSPLPWVVCFTAVTNRMSSSRWWSQDPVCRACSLSLLKTQKTTALPGSSAISHFK